MYVLCTFYVRSIYALHTLDTESVGGVLWENSGKRKENIVRSRAGIFVVREEVEKTMKAGELYFDVPAVFLLLLSSFSPLSP